MLSKAKKIPKYAVLTIFAIIIMFPVYMVLTGSLKTERELYDNVFGLPADPQWGNYEEAFVGGGLGKYYINSIIVTGVSIVLILVLSSMAAFALTRKFTKGSKLVYLLFVIGIAIPPQVAIIQLSLQMSMMHLSNTLWALIFSHVAYELPFSVFIFYGFMQDIPYEIQEAAIVDGCNNFQLYRKVIMPLSKGPIATVIIFNLVAIWNDMIFPLVLISDNNLKTLPIGLLQFKGMYISQNTVMFAGVVLISIPLIVLYLCLQKQFIRGMSQGAVKG
ncbi:carbohydrate ABC transporter permease [Christensenellaceae bacterium OttesenSCG-928-K19]|nr:carbohydrate ABC transporter permease [Christensenellaceae bacterium OttesenSCG-928-K19]